MGAKSVEGSEIQKKKKLKAEKYFSIGVMRNGRKRTDEKFPDQHRSTRTLNEFKKAKIYEQSLFWHYTAYCTLYTKRLNHTHTHTMSWNEVLQAHKWKQWPHKSQCQEKWKIISFSHIINLRAKVHIGEFRLCVGSIERKILSFILCDAELDMFC